MSIGRDNRQTARGKTRGHQTKTLTTSGVSPRRPTAKTIRRVRIREKHRAIHTVLSHIEIILGRQA